MNLLLLTTAEAADQPVQLRDDRARHIRDVLRGSPGDELKVGILDGPLGHAIVQSVSPTEVTLECTFEPTAPAPSEDTLLLAVPRPPVLARSLSLAATLGYGRILLFRTRRVDKSFLTSKVFEAATIRRLLIEGLTQGRRTHIPSVQRFDRFKPFVEDQLESLVPPGHRFVGHPGTYTPTTDLRIETRAPLTLAIGPEGGFIPYEIDALRDHGFQPTQAGPHPLRVETAIAYLTGQLHLLRGIAFPYGSRTIS